MKYIFDQNLIKQLQDGEIAINYGDSKMADRLDKLNAVLKLAFPTVFAVANGALSFYFSSCVYDGVGGRWLSIATDSPIQNVLLDKFFFEPGDTLYNDNNDEFLFVGFTKFDGVILEEIKAGSLRWYNAERMGVLSKLPPKTRLTKQQIADKFGISVENLEIV